MGRISDKLQGGKVEARKRSKYGLANRARMERDAHAKRLHVAHQMVALDPMHIGAEIVVRRVGGQVAGLADIADKLAHDRARDLQDGHDAEHARRE